MDMNQGVGECRSEVLCKVEGNKRGEMGVLDRQAQRGKNWDNSNSIINKIYLKNKTCSCDFGYGIYILV